ncbi:LysR family transcriptional regulator ArgP [Crossiella sp. SN42]|uniref:LysR family transcriptional regulator ArgP n=1 Tax=Crossiella sp. SN42 TaxID=2944808 RepID=UPI00207CCA03|nr:LysR family transcriptional regulator ArgP [Crossiella sp. SN42]MCO1576089.1 LysR family transcriptional regulator ArgP [Crossiella sp. SN42]
MMDELPFDQVRTLLAAVDEGTFEAAARALHVTPSAVSQRIKALEQRVGRVLLQRAKPVRLTPSGEVVARFGRQLALLAHDARAELGLPEDGRPTVLPVAVNADSLATWFLTALTRVPEHLQVCFALRREDQDHTTDLLREGLVLAAVTSSPEPVQGCSVRPLGRMRYRAMANPAFVERWLTGGPLAELLPEAPVVLFDGKDDLQHQFARARTGRDPSSRQHLVPASDIFLAAVVQGLGWGMIPDVQAGDHAARGLLTDLAPAHPVDVPLYWQQWKLDSPPLTALAEAVARTAAQHLAPLP